MGDGVVDYNDDGTDFAVTFSQNNTDTYKDIDIKEKVDKKVNTIRNDFMNKIELSNNFNESLNINENIIIDESLNINENVIIDDGLPNTIENVINYSENENNNTVDTITNNLENENNLHKNNEKVLFSVFQSESQEIKGVTKILFNKKEYDTHEYFCTNDSKFQPKVSGYYQINCGVNCFSQNGKTLLIELLKNGKVFKRGEQTNLLNEIINYKTVCLSSLIYLNGEDDYININVISSPEFLTYPGQEFTWLNGFLIN